MKSRRVKKSKKRSTKRSRKYHSRKHKKDGLCVDLARPFNTRFAPKAFGWN